MVVWNGGPGLFLQGLAVYGQSGLLLPGPLLLLFNPFNLLSPRRQQCPIIRAAYHHHNPPSGSRSMLPCKLTELDQQFKASGLSQEESSGLLWCKLEAKGNLLGRLLLSGHEPKDTPKISWWFIEHNHTSHSL